MKDNFSNQSSAYARFRPGYPEQLFRFLFQHCRHFDQAWDCGTGNGQIALQLAERFELVEASDISENQLNNAMPHPRVRYTLQAAEEPMFGDEQFDLVVVGQAAHWFGLDRFYTQARRVSKHGALLALVGYNLLKVDNGPIDGLIHYLYTDVLGAYWDVERRHVDAAYTSMPFPFEEIPFPEMSMTYTWTRDHLIGYLGTWSALQHFQKQHGYSPLDEAFLLKLEAAWPDGVSQNVQFPIFARVGRFSTAV